MPSNEETKSRMEEYEVKKRYEKRARMQNENDLVLDEAPNLMICLDMCISNKKLKKNVPKSYYGNKVYGREEIKKVLNDIYALFTTIKLKMIWKQHYQYLKFMEFLPKKKEKER